MQRYADSRLLHKRDEKNEKYCVYKKFIVPLHPNSLEGENRPRLRAVRSLTAVAVRCLTAALLEVRHHPDLFAMNSRYVGVNRDKHPHIPKPETIFTRCR